MSLKVVVFQVDDELLEENNLDFETELGWLKQSGINLVHIHEVSKDHEGVEQNLVQKAIDHLKLDSNQ